MCENHLLQNGYIKLETAQSSMPMGMTVLRKAGDSEVFVRLSHGAIVRCMIDHVKPVLRDNPDHIGNHRKTPETIAKSILDHAISLKSTACDVLISDILITKDKHQQKT